MRVPHVIIPLGMRCTSAAITRWVLRIDQPAFVFDWVQMTEKTMLDILSLDFKGIDPFFQEYFSGPFTEEKRHPVSGDWLPHDFPPGFDLESVKKKFIRRTQRLFEYLETDQKKVFLTTIDYRPSDAFPGVVGRFQKVLSNKIRGESLFLTINAGHVPVDTPDHKNLSVSAPSWDDLDQEAARWILDLGIIDFRSKVPPLEPLRTTEEIDSLNG